jgi:hypothetical protein
MLGTWQRGDLVMIECDGRALPGVVVMASANGASLMLRFSGILDGHADLMPTLRDPQGVVRGVMTNTAVKLTKRIADD